MLVGRVVVHALVGVPVKRYWVCGQSGLIDALARLVLSHGALCCAETVVRQLLRTLQNLDSAPPACAIVARFVG